MSTRLRRSELSTPGSNTKMIAKAAASEADLVFLDLEDSVAPAAKIGARKNIVDALNGLDWGRKLRAVRVNSADTQWAYEDVITIMEGAGERVDVLILPKIKAPRDLWFFETLVEQLEAKLGLENRVAFEVLIEETEALARVEDIAACSPRLEALILGVGDLSASQGVRAGLLSDSVHGYPGDFWHYARNRMIVAARANGLDPIDGPFADFRNPEGYRRQAMWAGAQGCSGKWAIHPSQIEIANDVFSPTEKEIAIARQMCDAYREAESSGAGAGSASGTMVDAATFRSYDGILERAKLTGRA